MFESKTLRNNARLHRPKKSTSESFVTGHDFSRAEAAPLKVLSRLQPAPQASPPTYSRTIFSDANAFMALRVSTISFADDSSPL